MSLRHRHTGSYDVTPSSTIDNYDPFGDESGVELYQFNDNALSATGTHDATATSITYSLGVYGNAAVFNSTSARINSDIILGSQSSISFWVKSSNNDIYDRTIEGSSGSNFIIRGQATNGVMGIYTNGAYSIQTSATDSSDCFCPDLNWHHIVVTDNGSAIKYYRDNIEITNIAAYTSIVGKLFNAIGYYVPLNTKNFQGSLDQFRIFNRALTAGEVAILNAEI